LRKVKACLLILPTLAVRLPITSPGSEDTGTVLVTQKVLPCHAGLLWTILFLGIVSALMRTK